MLLVASPAYPEPPIDGDKFRWTSLLRHLTELTPLHGVFGFMRTPTMEARDELFDRRFAGLDIVGTPNVEVTLRAGLLAVRGWPSAFGRRATPRWRRAVAAAAARHHPSSILLLGTSGGYAPTLPAPTVLRLGNSRRGIEWFLRESWPKIYSSDSTVRLRIVGYGADRISVSDRVEIYADVPTLRPHYAAAAVAVAPLLEARGVQNKAIEAMAAGLPVVCTSPVASGFFSAEPAWEVADNGEAIAQSCLSLLANPLRRAELGERGRRYVRANHDWRKSAEQLLSLLSQ